ncbi:hypothetical protein M5E89_01685 [Acidaminococcus intestini]|nr:hypothetical protein M5E89_01685 [Acidaminococcus intestini]
MNVPSGIKNYLMYGLPFFILVIYLKGYYDMFMPQGLAVFVKWLFMAACFLGFIIYGSTGRKTE